MTVTDLELTAKYSKSTSSNSLLSTSSSSINVSGSRDTLDVEKGAKADEKMQSHFSKPSSSAKGEDAIVDNDVVVLKEPPPKTETRSIKGATMKDVVVSEEAVNPILKGDKNKWNKDKPDRNDPEDFTRIVSIKDVPIRFVLLNELRPFAREFTDLQNTRRQKKKPCCDAILKEYLNPTYEAKKAAEEEAAAKSVATNYIRYANVLFGEAVRNSFALRGEPLTKDQLTDGIKRDQEFHELIVKEYNDETKYNEFVFPQLKDVCKSNPSKFGKIAWTKSKKTFATVMREYEICHANWKQSGCHGNFGEAPTADIPFANFVKTNSYLLYVHEFAKEHPSIMSKAAGTLSDEAFNESITPTKRKGSSKTPPRRSRSSSADSQAATLIDLTESSKQRNAVMNYAMLSNALNSTKTTLANDRKNKRELFEVAAKESVSDFEDVKAIKKRYKEFAAANASNNVPTSPDSLKSCFEQIMEVDHDIDHGKKEIENLKAEMAKWNNSSSNKE